MAARISSASTMRGGQGPESIPGGGDMRALNSKSITSRGGTVDELFLGRSNEVNEFQRVLQLATPRRRLSRQAPAGPDEAYVVMVYGLGESASRLCCADYEKSPRAAMYAGQ